MERKRRNYVTTKQQSVCLQTPPGLSWRDFLKQVALEEGSVERIRRRLGVSFNTAKTWYLKERLELGAQVVCRDLDEEARARFEAEQAGERSPLDPVLV